MSEKNERDLALELLDQACDADDCGEHDKALTLFEECIQIKPNNWYLWARKASALEDLGRIDDSKAAYKKSLHIDDKKAATWGLLGSLYYNQEHFEDAAFCCRHSNELEENSDTLTILAGAEIQTGDIESALKHAKRALELNPGWDEAEAIRDRALSILEGGE